MSRSVRRAAALMGVVFALTVAACSTPSQPSSGSPIAPTQAVVTATAPSPSKTASIPAANQPTAQATKPQFSLDELLSGNADFSLCQVVKSEEVVKVLTQGSFGSQSTPGNPYCKWIGDYGTVRLEVDKTPWIRHNLELQYSDFDRPIPSPCPHATDHVQGAKTGGAGYWCLVNGVNFLVDLSSKPGYVDITQAQYKALGQLMSKMLSRFGQPA